MSEKIYACLLRLFPAHFRRDFEEDALQLFRDRSRDEKGLFAQLRLWIDLILDLVVSVPREYRRIERRSSSHLPYEAGERLPAFRVLEAGWVRLDSLLIGGFVSLVVVSAIPALIYRAASDQPLEAPGYVPQPVVHPPWLWPRGSISQPCDQVEKRPPKIDQPFTTSTRSGAGGPKSVWLRTIGFEKQKEIPPAPQIPESPAGRVLRLWLEAFNSSDPSKLEAFITNVDPEEVAGRELGLRHHTGGFKLVSIAGSHRYFIEFVLKEKNTDTHVLASIRVSEKAPARIVSFGRTPFSGSPMRRLKLDSAEKQRVIEGILLNLRRYYVDPEMAQKMADALVVRQKCGDYASETDGTAFADLLTRQMTSVSHDRHLGLDYRPAERRDGNPGAADQEASFRAEMIARHCDVEKVQILSENIGYIKLNGFPDPSVCQSTVNAAMQRLNGAAAVIFDVRDNGGGSPQMVALVCGYLFDHRTHLNDMYNRTDNRTWQSWTQSPIHGNHLADKPVYVLTSAETFSGGEEFAYDLKSLKRATIIGERTGGGAHLVTEHRIDDYFVIGVPSGRPINPITRSDWEGTGVEPDMTVKASNALDTAETLAKAKLQ